MLQSPYPDRKVHALAAARLTMGGVSAWVWVSAYVAGAAGFVGVGRYQADDLGDSSAGDGRRRLTDVSFRSTHLVVPHSRR
jgi:hypothetical protein